MRINKCHCFLKIGVVVTVLMSRITSTNCKHCELSSEGGIKKHNKLVYQVTPYYEGMVTTSRVSEKYSLYKRAKMRKRELFGSLKKYIRKVNNKSTFETTCTSFFISRLKSVSEKSILKYVERPPAYQLVNKLNENHSTPFRESVLKDNYLENKRGKLKNFFFSKTTIDLLPFTNETDRFTDVSNQVKSQAFQKILTTEVGFDTKGLSKENFSKSLNKFNTSYKNNSTLYSMFNKDGSKSEGKKFRKKFNKDGSKSEEKRLKKKFLRGRHKTEMKTNEDFAHIVYKYSERETTKPITETTFGNPSISELGDKNEQVLSKKKFFQTLFRQIPAKAKIDLVTLESNFENFTDKCQQRVSYTEFEKQLNESESTQMFEKCKAKATVIQERAISGTSSVINFTPYTKFKFGDLFNFHERTTDSTWLELTNPLFKGTKILDHTLLSESGHPAYKSLPTEGPTTVFKANNDLDTNKSCFTIENGKHLELNKHRDIIEPSQPYQKSHKRTTMKKSSNPYFITSSNLRKRISHTEKSLVNFKNVLHKDKSKTSFFQETTDNNEYLQIINVSTDTSTLEIDNNQISNIETTSTSLVFYLDSTTSDYFPKNRSNKTGLKGLFHFNKPSPFVSPRLKKASLVPYRNSFLASTEKVKLTLKKLSKFNKSSSPNRKKVRILTTDLNESDLDKKDYATIECPSCPTFLSNSFESQVPATPLASKLIVDLSPEIFFQELNSGEENLSTKKQKLNFNKKNMHNWKKHTATSREKAFSLKSGIKYTQIYRETDELPDQLLTTINKSQTLLDDSVNSSDDFENSKMPTRLNNKFPFNFKKSSIRPTQNTVTVLYYDKNLQSDQIEAVSFSSCSYEKEINNPSKLHTNNYDPVESVSYKKRTTEDSFKFQNLFIFRKPTTNNTNLSYNFDPGGSPSTKTSEMPVFSTQEPQQTGNISTQCYSERCDEVGKLEDVEIVSFFRNKTSKSTSKALNNWKFWDKPKTTEWYFITKPSQSTPRPIVETEEGNLFRWHVKHFEGEEIETMNSDLSVSSDHESLSKEFTTNNVLSTLVKSVNDSKKLHKGKKGYFKKSLKTPEENIITNLPTSYTSAFLNCSSEITALPLIPGASQIYLKGQFTTNSSSRKNKTYNEHIRATFPSTNKVKFKNKQLKSPFNNSVINFLSSLNFFKLNKTNETLVKDPNINNNNFDAKNLSYFVQNLTLLSDKTNPNKSLKAQVVLNQTESFQDTINNTDLDTTNTTSKNESTFSIMAYVLRPLESLISVFKGKTPQNMTKVGDVNTSEPFHNGSIPSHLRPQNSSLVILALNNTNKTSFEMNGNSSLVVDLSMNDSSNATRDLHEPKMGLFDVLGGWFHCMVETYSEPKPTDVHFYLFTRKNADDPEELFISQDIFKEENTTDLPEPIRENESSDDVKKKRQSDYEESDFEPLNFATSELESKLFNIMVETKVLVHGYIQDFQTDIIVNMKDAYLKKADLNVIVVDWSVIGDNTCYPVVAEHGLRSVGRLLGRLLDQLVEGGVALAKVHVVGFSLGAHVAGYAGTLTKHGLVSRITGLDPALPYVPMDPDVSLDVGDAAFVDIVHSAAGYLGQPGPMGSVDFYPNGGSQQPGCDLASLGACSHRRAALYFIESINSEVGFKARRCESWHDFQSSLCNNSASVLMGDECPSSARGKYFLYTGHKEPFALLSREHNKVKKSLLLDIFYEMV